MASNARRYGPVQAGSGGKRTAGCRPYGGKVPVLSLRDQSADWSWQSVTPVPFSNVFKWQFENTTIFNSQFSIFNSPRAGCGTRTAESRPYGGSVSRLLSPAIQKALLSECLLYCPRSDAYWAFLASLAAFLAVSTRVPKALGSAMAISDRALRFISMPACFRPYMNQL